jgi:glutaredoxin
VKEFLSHYNVPYTEFNVREDNHARDELVNKYNSMSTPTVVVGEKVLVGFEPDKLAEALDIKIEE